METKHRILIVDDDPDLCANIQEILEVTGCHVDYCNNGKDAIELFEKNKYFLAIIDINLPDIQGNELVDKLYEISSFSDFIYLTGHASIDNAIHAVSQEHVVSFETKPINIEHLLAIVNQVTKRKQAEQEILESSKHIMQLNRIYAVLSEVNQLIVRERNEQTLLDKACSIAVEKGEFKMAWIGQVDKKNAKVNVVAKNGFIGRYLASINKDLGDKLQSGCIAGIAIKTKENAIVNNIETDERMKLRREAAMKNGYRSCASFPLIVSGKVYGILNLYSGTADFFTEDEVRLLDEMAMDISFAIESIQMEKQKKIAQEEMRKSQELFSNAFNNAPIGEALVAPDGRWLKVNRTICEISGYSEEELLTMTFQELTHPDDLELDLKYVREMLAKKIKTYQLDKRYIHASGHPVWVSLHVSLIWDSNDKPQYFIAQIQDISQRRKAEEELAKYQEKLEEIVKERTSKLENTNKKLSEEISIRKKTEDQLHRLSKVFTDAMDPIIIEDLSGKVIDMNESAVSIFGWTREELLGKSIKTIVPNEQHKQADELQEKCIQGKSIRNEKGWRLHKSGELIPVLLSLSLLTNQKEEPTAIATISKNISNIIETEEKLKIAKENAEIANRSKSEFVANMSHEIRTPMNAVLGYAELLTSQLIDKTQKRYLESIKASGRSLLTLINDILDLSKIEAGKLELQFDYVDSHSFFHDLEHIFSLRIIEKGINFIVEISSGTPAGIYIDESRLRQVLVNLLGNAVKFTDTGYIKLSVWVENPKILEYDKDKGEEYVDLIIEVEDTGTGIPKEYLQVIFDPFEQSKEKINQKLEGTGLGLAISRRLVELMNGTITASSELNEGSTFRVVIPDMAYRRTSEKREPELFIDPETVNFDEATVLIVDDVSHNRNFLIDALSNTQLNIIEAENGEQAHNLAQELVPDLIIADLRMPVMDGFELLNNIKEDNRLKHIPVIAYSASAMKSQKEKILESDFIGLLTKPVQITELYLELMNHLSHRKIEKEKITKPEPFEEIQVSAIKDLPGLIEALETELHDLWKTFSKRQPLNEVKDFGERLIELGRKHNAAILADYGNELITATDIFDVQTIQRLLGSYPELMERFRKIRNT